MEVTAKVVKGYDIHGHKFRDITIPVSDTAKMFITVEQGKIIFRTKTELNETKLTMDYKEFLALLELKEE